MRKNRSLLNLKLMMWAALWGAYVTAMPLSTRASSERTFDLSALPNEKIEEVQEKFPDLKKGQFTRAQIDQLIQYLITEENYETAEVYLNQTAGSEKYFLNVGKTQRLFRIKLSGQRFFSESELKKESGIVEKSPLDSQSIAEGVERIKRAYRERGYRKTEIQVSAASISPTDVEVLLQVSEGPQLRIKSAILQSPSSEFNEAFRARLNSKLKNEPYTEKLITDTKKEFRSFFSKKGYFKAELSLPQFETSPDGESAELTFTVLNPELFNVEVKGALKYTPSTIQTVLDLDNFYSTNPNIGPELSNKIKNYYLKAGYARVSVTGDEQSTGKAFQKQVTLEVNEGPRIRIDEIKFSGTYTGPESSYREFIQTHSSDLISKGYYNRDELQVGINNLIVGRQNHGFLRAKILSTKTIFTGPDKEFAHIQINFDEGPLTLLKNIEFQGNKQISRETLLNVLKLQENQPLRLNELEDAVAQIKNYYQNEGFLEMKLLNEKNSEKSIDRFEDSMLGDKKSIASRDESNLKSIDLVQYNVDSTEAKVFLKIYEGPKIRVASIVLEGNTLTKDSVIFHELDFKVGDVLTPDRIEESTRRLQRVGHFNFVEIKTLEEKTQIADRTIIVKVSDRDPGLFTIGAGVNSENGLTLRGYTGIGYRNILGTGRGASARLEGNYNPTDIKYLEYKVTLGYLEPYLLDTRAKGRLNYTIDEYVHDFKNRKATNLKQITWTLEQDITSHVLLSFDVFSSAQVRKFALADVDNKSELIIASTGPTLTVDYRDHPFNTTKGTLSRVGTEYSSPDLGSTETIHYIKSFASFTHYTPVKTGWVWANSWRGSSLKNLCDVDKNSSCGVPYDLKGITLGGQSTIRGFLADEAFPNKYDLRDSNGAEILPSDFKLTTQAVSFLFKSELRFPIWGAIGGALFYDGGAVWIRGQNFEDPYRDAIGLGFRYATPIGSVSFDIGYKLDRNSRRGEEMFPVYLSIGTF